jgi:hypothetical protein
MPILDVPLSKRIGKDQMLKNEINIRVEKIIQRIHSEFETYGVKSPKDYYETIDRHVNMDS